MITGLQPPTGGTVVLDDRDITNVKPHRRARLGIGRTFQRLETFGTLSVRDNVLVAAEMRRGWSREKFKPGDLTDELIERLGLTSVATERVDRLPTGTQRLVEMARALATKPRVVLLDEPSAGLNEAETTELAELLIELAATGLAILLVEHDMGLVMSSCHHIHVLDFGQIIAFGTPTEVQENALVRAAYLGEGDEAEEVPEEQQALLEEVSALQTEVRAESDAPNGAAPVASVSEPLEATAPGTPTPGAAIELINVKAAYGSIDVLHDVNITIAPGTVYALLGPNGAGKSTTLKVASGRLNPTSGEVRYLGERINGRASRPPGARRPVHHPRGPRHLPQPHRAREPPHHDLQRGVVVDRRRARVHAFPAVEGAPQADGRHVVRW